MRAFRAHRLSVFVATSLFAWTFNAFARAESVDERSSRQAQRLGDDYTAEQREEARLNLEQLGSDALPALQQKLFDKEPGPRLRVIEVLGELRDPRAAMYLLKAYDQNTSSAVRTKILESLGKMRDVTLARWFIQQTQNPDLAVRCYAVWALGELRLQSSAPYLLELAQKERGTLRVTAVDALSKSGTEDQVLPLTEFLRFDDTELRYVTAKALGALGSARATPVLSELLLQEADIEVQEAMAGALGKIGGEAGAKRFIQILQETPSPLLEHLAERGLESAGKTAIPLLLPLLNGRDTRLRIAAARVLAATRAPEVIPHLLRILKDGDQTLQLSVIAAIGECGTWDNVSELSAMARSNDRVIREASADAIKMIARRHEEIYQQITPSRGIKGAP